MKDREKVAMLRRALQLLWKYPRPNSGTDVPIRVREALYKTGGRKA